MCLGQEDAADLRAALRASPDDAVVAEAIREAITRKPRPTTSSIARQAKPAVARHMSTNGG